MSLSVDFESLVKDWANRTPFVQAVVLFGSQAREEDPICHPDAQSDWDFQVITSRPKVFLDSGWVREVTDMKLHAYAVRVPRVGEMPKVTAVLGLFEADFVIIPLQSARLAKLAVRLGLHRRKGRTQRSLQGLSIVIRPGYRFLKGGEAWDSYYKKVISEVEDARLDDGAVRVMAESFVCDYVSALRKLERGELLAIQRMLHRELAETNFRLLHELKLRRGERSFPEARRLERVATPNEFSRVSVSAMLNGPSLRTALAESAATLRTLVHALIDDSWDWPNV